MRPPLRTTIQGSEGRIYVRFPYRHTSTVRWPMRKLLLLFLAVLFAGSVFAAEPTRRAQEELRRRNLFFGEVDGQESPELSAALKLYQTHKGFEPTGELDDLTARSLGVETEASAAEPTVSATKWPDVPVLKSDVARALPPATEAALEQKAVANINLEPAPEIPAESPEGPQNVDPKTVTSFIENYLRDNENNNLATQMKYYSYPIDYFDHGKVGRKFVEADNRNYMRRWPVRHYQLLGPVHCAAGPKEGETIVEFPTSFHVRNRDRTAAGETRNFWTIKPEGGKLKIVAIKEEHLRE